MSCAFFANLPRFDCAFVRQVVCDGECKKRESEARLVPVRVGLACRICVYPQKSRAHNAQF